MLRHRFDIKRQDKADSQSTFGKLGGASHCLPGWPLDLFLLCWLCCCYALYSYFQGNTSKATVLSLRSLPIVSLLLQVPRAGSIRSMSCRRAGGSCKLVCDTLSSHISLLCGPPKALSNITFPHLFSFALHNRGQVLELGIQKTLRENKNEMEFE